MTQFRSPIISPEARKHLVETTASFIASGGVVAIPTDTLYGLAAHPMIDSAVARLFAIKQRPIDSALPLLIADNPDIERYASVVPEKANLLADAYWPGPLTIVLPKASTVPDSITAGRNTVGLRIPDHWAPREIVRTLGSAITGTSANVTRKPGIKTAHEVRATLGDELDYVLDGGRCNTGIASTVIELTDHSALLLREGAISVSDLASTIGDVTIVREVSS